MLYKRTFDRTTIDNDEIEPVIRLIVGLKVFVAIWNLVWIAICICLILSHPRWYLPAMILLLLKFDYRIIVREDSFRTLASLQFLPLKHQLNDDDEKKE